MKKAFRFTIKDQFGIEQVFEEAFPNKEEADNYAKAVCKTVSERIDFLPIKLEFTYEVEEFDPPIIDFRKYTPEEIVQQLEAMDDEELVQGILWNGDYDDIITAGKSRFAMELIANIRP